MKTTHSALLAMKLGTVVVTATLVLALSPMHGVTVALGATPALADDANTEDILHMRDGRVLTGKIISESGDQIIFRYVDRQLNIQTQMTLNKSEILNIERDVELEHTGGASRETEQTDGASDTDEPDEPMPSRRRGLAEGSATDESLPSFYVIPMKGQMGTDIRLEVYSDIIDDIRAQKPDVIVWELKCADSEDHVLAPMFWQSGRVQEERGLMQLVDDYRLLVQRLHDELRDIRQVMWVHDAWGVGAVMALAWPEMYMAPKARLVGMAQFFQEHGGDDDIKAKMREAWIGIGNGFLQRGGRPVQLGFGLMNPKTFLSASWQGRDVVWKNDTSGDVIINASDKYPATFNAKTAEDFGISHGTVENLDDLAMLLGFREYRVLEGDALRSINRYRADWRRELTRVWERFADYQQHRGWASGDQALTWLGRAMQDLQYIAQAMRRYPAIEIRVRLRGGPDRLSLELTIEQLQQQIAEMRRAGRGGRGGRGGGGGGFR